MHLSGIFQLHFQFSQYPWCGQLLRFPYLMTVTHLSECGKEKLKNWHVIVNSWNPDDLSKMHLGLAGLLHFVRNDGILDSRHCNKASAASEARQRRSRRGNPECLVIAITSDLPACWLSRLASSFIRRRSRRGNPDGLNKMHFCLAGLLHFVRNDGILNTHTSFAMTARVS
jgi:hypothetical protein